MHNHDNDYLDWLLQQNLFALRESTSIISGNGKGFTLRNYIKDMKLTIQETVYVKGFDSNSSDF